MIVSNAFNAFHEYASGIPTLPDTPLSAGNSKINKAALAQKRQGNTNIYTINYTRVTLLYEDGQTQVSQRSQLVGYRAKKMISVSLPNTMPFSLSTYNITLTILQKGFLYKSI